MNEDIDMEELEARLYGQVHYGNCDDENTTSSNSNNEIPTVTNSHQQTRYFTNFPSLPHIYQTYESPFVDTNLYSQLGLMLNPAAVNNIVVVQQPPTQIFTNRNFDKPKIRTRRAKRKRRQALKRKLFKNTVPCFKGFKEHHLSKCNKSEGLHDNSQHQVFASGTRDKYSCEIIEPKIDVFVISSDDEFSNVKKESECKAANSENVTILDKIDDSEDVIFVETNQPEIISIDCDEEKVDNCAISTITEQNDFLEDNILLNDGMFVDDVDLSDTSDIQQSTILNVDVSDSESSTTSESPNRIFRESAFETTGKGKDVSALSLDDFENYITASGKFVAGSSVIKQTTDVNASASSTNKQSNYKESRNSSDSSSESDYDDNFNDTTLSNNQSNKSLPNLSPIVSDDEVFTGNFNSTVIEINSGECKTIHGGTKTNETNASVICISSSDESSDAEIDMNKSIELLNIEGSKVFPKEEISSVKSEPTRFSDFWTDDMQKFYNESWGQENFSCEEVQKKMSDDPKMWKIIDKDFTNTFATPRGIRCHRCRQFGHKSLNCPTRSAIPKCILCGCGGHYEAKCPNKLCSACGEKIPFWTIYCQSCTNLRFIFCKICCVRGHTSAHCTDLWRRYHLTISEGPVIRPEKHTFKLPEDRWCCGCASQGHYEHECNYHIRTYPQTIPFVHCYDDVYAHHDGFLNENTQNSLAQTGIPSLLTLKIDNNEILQHQQQARPIQLTISTSEASQLLKPNGVKFLKNISRKTDLQIKVLKRGLGVFAKYVCNIQGSDCYKSKAVNKIKQYCANPITGNTLLGLFNTTPLTKQVLKQNFEKFKIMIPWIGLIKNTYNKILTFERQLICRNLKQNRKKARKNLSLYYMALNAVLIGKFNADDQQYLEILKSWKTSKGNYTNEIVKQAYEFVFLNSKRANIDYDGLIKNMSLEADRAYYLHINEIDRMMRTNTELCQKLNLHKDLSLLENYYQMILQRTFNYKYVFRFKRLCRRLNVKYSR